MKEKDAFTYHVVTDQTESMDYIFLTMVYQILQIFCILLESVLVRYVQLR